MTRWQWLSLAAIVLFGLALRVHDVGKVFIWVDETGFFNADVYGAHPKGLVDYAWGLKEDPATTNTWAWPGAMWLSCRIFGGTIGAARIPFVLVGAAAVPLTFWLIYVLLPASAGRLRFAASTIGGLLAAMTITQLDFSQRVFPYAATPFATCAILLAHLRLLRINETPRAGRSDLLASVAIYAGAGVLGLCTHPSMALLLGVSAIFLVIGAAFSFRKVAPPQRPLRIVLAAATAAVFAGIALLNQKNPDSGRHDYLAPYYHGLSIRGLGKLVAHLYDLATYHLNLFYNTSLYWPERLNIVLLPLALLCFAGWFMAAAGRFGGRAKHFALLSAAAVAVPAILSATQLRLFPFGGVRQTIYLSPILFVFCALGLGSLLSSRRTWIAGFAIGAAYISLWAINLPRFYADRLTPYTPEDIVRVWRDHGKLPFYAAHGNLELRYAIREHPEIRLLDTGYKTFPDPRTSYFLADTRASLEDQGWLPGLAELFRQSGQRAELLSQAPARHAEIRPTYFGSTYFPPSGLWIYKISPNSALGGPETSGSAENGGAVAVRKP